MNETYTDMENRPTLDEIGVRCGTDKSSITHHYLQNYAPYIESWRDKEFTMLEIGVAGGASMKMWKEYFPKARVFGVDNNPDCASYVDGVFIGDHNNSEFMACVMEKIGKCDLIIDDGSHVGHDMIRLFGWLFHLWVNAGGLYVVEDTHCFYHEHYNQGSGAFNFFTGLAKDVDVAGRGMTGNADYAINKAATDVPVPAYSRFLKSMHIHPSLWIFERK